ncbi:MAG: M16 family metallopeptidase [Planctomycetota bacterium]|jgi:predicted Zn-dependent peptidase
MKCKSLNLFALVLLVSIFLFPGFSAYAQKPDRSSPPELGPPPAMKLPGVQRFELDNGLPVVLMEKHEIPLVQVNLLVNSGAVMDPKGKTGLASITGAMLDEGAGSRNALELADAIDFLGARISTSAGLHTSRISLHTPLSKLDAALALMADIAMRPTFPAEELERQRKQRLTTLIQWHDEPRNIASVLFNRTLFGKDHPYGKPTLGGEKSIREFSSKDLKNFHGTYFHPKNATLIVVGDVTREAVVSKLETVFGQWSAGKRGKVSLPSAKQIQKRTVCLVDKPGAAQSEIRIGRIGVPRTTDDYYAIVVMNTILGGSFASRLNQNLREDKGYSYGARSSFGFRPQPGPFTASSAVQTDVTDKALLEFMKELNGILQPVSDEELTRGKNFVALRFPERFQTVSRIANQLETLVTYDLPDDYFNQYTRKILAVSKSDVRRVAEKYIVPGKMAVVVVGDRAKIETGVRDLKLGSMEVMTIEEVLGKAPVLAEKNK